MQIVEALGDPCCHCGSRQIIREPVHLLGACVQCSPAVLAERRWNDRIARAVGRTAKPPVAQRQPVPALPNGSSVSNWPARPLFGRLPRRRGPSAPMPAGRKIPVQLTLPGF